jgi:hypothetical protein
MDPYQLKLSYLSTKCLNGIYQKMASHLIMIVLAFMCFCGTVMAQHRSNGGLTYGGGGTGGGNFDSGYGIAFGVGYDAPLGDLKTIYKPSATYNLSVVRFMGNFTASFTLGYHAYKPKADVLYYSADGTTSTTTDDSEAGTVSYSDFKVYSGYAGIVYNVDISDDTRFYGGLNLGAYRTHYGFRATSASIISSADVVQQNIYIAPKVGITYALNNIVGLSLEAKYNLFSPTQRVEFDGSPGGSLYKSVAGVAAITVRL